MKLELNQNDIVRKYPGILEILLLDNTTKKNIIWATSNYSRKGKGYFIENNIVLELITSRNGKIIRSRTEKSKMEQAKRSKDNAEVFTPSWICNKQNNLIDNEWFGYNNSFNVELDLSWEATPKVIFKDKNWVDYVNDTRLEITCGEAPYIVSRYDTVTGKEIPLKSRIGLLDRKFRVINENATDNEWIKYSLLALKATFGYEFQGDNLLIARENVFLSYVEYYIEKFKDEPSLELLTEVATIISWNFWQMDGLKCVVPFTCKDTYTEVSNLFGEVEKVGDKCEGCKNNNINKHNGKYSLIMDWERKQKIKFKDLIKRCY